jgi:hypothetical protein
LSGRQAHASVLFILVLYREQMNDGVQFEIETREAFAQGS